MTKKVVLHVGPHPDDEVLGAGATLALLRSNGWDVHNLACTLGRPADHDRRRIELLEAAARAGYTTTIADPLIPLSGTDNLDRGAELVREAVLEVLEQTGASVVISPHPHDGHHAHEAVGRGVRDALTHRDDVVWWMWGLWADLPVPTLMTVFDESTLDEVSHSIAAYAGENERNSYDLLYPARATAAAVLGSERVFGTGAARASSLPYAELLTETRYDAGRWLLGEPRLLDPSDPVVQAGPNRPDLAPVLSAPSPRQHILIAQPGR